MLSEHLSEHGEVEPIKQMFKRLVWLLEDNIENFASPCQDQRMSIVC